MKKCLVTLFTPTYESISKFSIKSFEEFSIINKCSLLVYNFLLDISIYYIT